MLLTLLLSLLQPFMEVTGDSQSCSNSPDSLSQQMLGEDFEQLSQVRPALWSQQSHPSVVMTYLYVGGWPASWNWVRCCAW